MILKTSNQLLLGYVAGLFLLIGSILIFGFTHVANLPGNRFTSNAEINSEAMDEFSVLHINGNASLDLDKGEGFEIIRTSYPNDTVAVNIDYYISNDTCFVTRWERNGMNHAVLKVGRIETVIVENDNTLFLNDFKQDKLAVLLHSGKVVASHMSKVNLLDLTASGGAYAGLQGDIHNLQLYAVDSEIQVYNYLDSISGEIKQNSRLNLFKGVGKLNFKKSTDSKLSTN